MGLKDFIRDLKSVKTGTFAHISEVKRSDIEGGLSFTFSHHGLQTPADIQMLVPEPQDYPSSHSYMLFVDGDCPAAIASALNHVGEAVERKVLSDALITISQKLSTRVERPSEPLTDLPAVNADEKSQTQDDKDLDSDQYDTSDQFSDSSDAFCESSHLVAGAPKKYSAKANITLISSITLKRELADAQSHGIAVGIYREMPSHGTVASLAFPVSRLRASAHALEAWGLDPAGYVVLLIGVRGLYPEAALQIEQRDSFAYTDFRLGQCSTVKPSRRSVVGVFEGKSVEKEAEEESASGPAGDFDHVYMSKAIDILLREQFLDLLYIRISRGFSWDEAQVHLVEVARDMANAGVETAGRSKASGLDGPIPGDFVANPGPQGLNLALVACQLVLYRLEQCTNFCMVCFRPVKESFEAILPYICGDALCFFHYNNLGIGVNIDREIVEHPYVVDMLVCFFCKAVRGDALRDHPVGLRLNSTRTKPDAPGNNSWQVEVNGALMRIREKPGPPQAQICASPGQYFQLSHSLDTQNPGACDPLCRLLYREGEEWSFENLDGQLLLQRSNEWHFATAFIMKTEVDDLPWSDQRSALLGLIDQVPSVLEMRSYLLERSGRKLNDWTRLTVSALRLLTWIVATNRSFITQDSEVPDNSDSNRAVVPSPASTHKIGSLPPYFIQFRFAQGSPEKEIAFKKSIADEFPAEPNSEPEIASMFAWHGSPLQNWHSILRSGLDFAQVAHGRASGDGVYFSSHYNTSISFSHRVELTDVTLKYDVSPRGWRSSQLGISAAISICEVIKKPSKFVSRDPHYVVNQLDWIQCRYLLLKVDPSEAAIKLPFPSPPTRSAEGFIPQDPNFILRGPEKQILAIPDYVSEYQGGDCNVKAHAEVATCGAADLGDDLDVALPTNEGAGTKRRGSEVDVMSPYAPSPPKLDNASHERKTKAVDDGITRTFVPGSLDHATLPRLPSPAWKNALATARVQTEVRDMQRVQSATDDIHSLGWYMDFDNMTNIFHWIVELHSFDASTPLAKDMAAQCIDSIVLEIRFGSNYNMSPPFIRVVRPRFLPFAQGGGGHVTEGGAICSELLTRSGWSSAYDMQKVLLAVRVGLTDEERPARLASNQMGGGGDYNVMSAIDAYKRAARTHGWEVTEDLDQIASQG